MLLTRITTIVLAVALVPANAQDGQDQDPAEEGTTTPDSLSGPGTDYPTTSEQPTSYDSSYLWYSNYTTTAYTVSHFETTLVTVTSCDQHRCTQIPSTAQVSTATTTINGVVTEYITWCPISTTTHGPIGPPHTNKTKTVEPTSERPPPPTPDTTKTKTIEPTSERPPPPTPDITKTKTIEPTSERPPPPTPTTTKTHDRTTSNPPEKTTTGTVSTFEGGAAKLGAASLFGILPILFI